MILKCDLFIGASSDRLPSTVDHCSPNPCQNRAICRTRGDGYSCFCVPGFQGAHCQIDVNECASQPCKNGGTCVDKVGRFSCLCSPAFTGEWTEQNSAGSLRSRLRVRERESEISILK